MRQVTIKDHTFQVVPFTAYESLMLAGDIAKVASKVINGYEEGNILSIFTGLSDVETTKLMNIVERVCAKVLLQDNTKLDLHSQKWSGGNLTTIMYLVWDIVKTEYSAVLEDTGLGELLKTEETEESNSKTSTNE